MYSTMYGLMSIQRWSHLEVQLNMQLNGKLNTLIVLQVFQVPASGPDLKICQGGAEITLVLFHQHKNDKNPAYRKFGLCSVFKAKFLLWHLNCNQRWVPNCSEAL